MLDRVGYAGQGDVQEEGSTCLTYLGFNSLSEMLLWRLRTLDPSMGQNHRSHY